MIRNIQTLNRKYDPQVAVYIALRKNVTGEYFTMVIVTSYLYSDADTNCGRIFSVIVSLKCGIAFLSMSLCLILLILSKTDLMHIGNTYIFYFIIVQPTPEPDIRIICLNM